jgi:hypothetical protein
MSPLVVALVLAGFAPAAAGGAGSAASQRHGHHLLVRHSRLVAVDRSATAERGQNLIDSGAVKLTSSTGLPLHLYLFFDQFGRGASSGTDVEVGLFDDRGETHLWSYDVANRAVIYDSVTGRGEVRAGSAEIGSFGSINLDIRPAGAATVTRCVSGGRRVVRPVTLRGTVDFDTQSESWGKVGDPTARIEFSRRASAESDLGTVGAKCSGESTGRCHASVLVDRFGPAGFLFGGSSRRHGAAAGWLEFDHEVSLPEGLSGWRDDFADADLPPPKLRHAGRGVAVTLDATADEGVVSGAATWHSTGKPSATRAGCRGGATAQSWVSSYTNRSSPLTFAFSFGGTYSYADARHAADIELTTPDRG